MPPVSSRNETKHKKLQGFCYAICNGINRKDFPLNVLPAGINVGKHILVDVLWDVGMTVI